jgi:hypothetical protein
MMNKGLLCITSADMMHLMTTKNPRLTITLQPTLAAQLRRLSELTGDSQSAIIAELLEGSAPVFERLIAVLTAAQGAKEAMKGRLAADMEQAQGKVEAQLGIALEHFDAFTKPLLDEAEAIKRRARRGAVARPESAQAGAGARPDGAGGATAQHASTASKKRASAGDLDGELTPLSNRGVRYDQTTIKTIAKKQAKPMSKQGKVG